MAQLERMVRQEQDPIKKMALQKELNVYERKVSERRQSLRLQSAELEALLFKWGYITTFVNPKTPQMLDKIRI